MPVAAVIAGGRPNVSSGSANTALASRSGEKSTFFTCVTSSEMTDERPTSDPVPEVVGTATKYGIGWSIGRTCGWSHAYSRTSPGCVPMSATALATSTAAPPPRPITASARCARNAAAPAITCDPTGLPEMPENAAASRPPNSAMNSDSKGSAAMPRSVTTSGRVTPALARCSPTSLRAPGPKWMVVGKPNFSMAMAREEGAGGGACGARPAGTRD